MNHDSNNYVADYSACVGSYTNLEDRQELPLYIKAITFITISFLGAIFIHKI